MIKKFKEFIKEEYLIDIEDILPYYEVEDHFLRLKEVFGMSADILYRNISDSSYDPPCSYYYIDFEKLENDGLYSMPNRRPTFVELESPKQSDEKILSEISQIKKRLESMYPVQVNINDTYITIVAKEFGEEFVNWDKPQKIKESMQDISFYATNKNKIEYVLPKTDLEDHFLRLSEVFNCSIIYIYRDKITIGVFPKEDVEKANYEEIIKEIYQIKYRLENIYPDLDIKFTKSKITSEAYEMFSISLKN